MIDCKPLLQNFVHGYSARFIMNCHEYLLQNKNDAQYWFIVDKTYSRNAYLNSIPVKNIILQKGFTNSILRRIWPDYQLQSLLKKYDADLLINTGGIASASSIAQCSWMPVKPENKEPKKNRYYNGFYKIRLQKTLQKSQMIFALSEKSKQQIIGEYNFDSNRIIVARTAADERYRVLSWTEKESMKVKYSAGKEYFIISVDGASQNLIHLLKAFSQFKKRQQSNIQLVFSGAGLENESSFLEKLETFKYRTDVHIYGNLDEAEKIKLIAAAYALVHPFCDDETGSMVLNALRANVPVIASDKGSLREIAADAALYASPDDVELLASQLMLMYKDEKLRAQLIEKGKLQYQLFNRNDSMEKLYQAMMQATEGNHNISM
jgi:glycosyltransferase involved in cell wall biosynthesis